MSRVVTIMDKTDDKVSLRLGCALNTGQGDYTSTYRSTTEMVHMSSTELLTEGTMDITNLYTDVLVWIKMALEK